MTDPTKNWCSENPTGAISKRSFRIDTSRKDGLLLQIHHTITARNKKSKHFKFNETTFDDTGEQLAAIDHVGNIVVIDFSCLRFWMLPLRLECSFIKFSSYRKNELLIGKLDGSVLLIDTGNIVSFSL
ncbi:TBC1 domain family member 31-like [Nilaparvata lugens]|uniref:TBC1 domain family member 31-like n=1 Tax=Nilaparvata lugens TaxID=108931 RepID=UPI00193E2A1E|nr:TBC1 domain family member 31-like [Nilaparvata lugens]